jgi:hypothetical protein
MLSAARAPLPVNASAQGKDVIRGYRARVRRRATWIFGREPEAANDREARTHRFLIAPGHEDVWFDANLLNV